jgi:hypothetical protein
MAGSITNDLDQIIASFQGVGLLLAIGGWRIIEDGLNSSRFSRGSHHLRH